MGYRTILSSPVTVTVKNTSGQRIVVSGGNLAPGKQRRISGEVFVNDKFRAAELANLAVKSKIQVLLNGNGWVNYALNVSEIRALAANVAAKPVRVAATVALPAATDVPEGSVAYDTTLATLVTSVGGAWV